MSIRKDWDSDDVKAAARGHWREILSTLAGIPAEQLDGQHHPCLLCNGSDRFNACRKSFDQTGTCFCNQCDLSGDGWHVLQKVSGLTFAEAVQAVGEFLVCDAHSAPREPSAIKQPANRKPSTKSKPAPAGMKFPDAKAALLRSIRSRLPEGVTVPDEPTRRDAYHKADGAVAGCVFRWDRSDGEKEIRPLSMTVSGWSLKAMPEPRPLWNLPAVLEADIIHIAEGEKAAEAMQSFGLVATTSAGGRNAAAKTDWSVLSGKRVTICRDHDAPGAKYRDKAAALICEQAKDADIHVAELSECWPKIPSGGDAADWSEQFDSQQPEWFREQVESITKPVNVEQRTLPNSGKTDAVEWPDLIPFDDPDLLRLDPSVLPNGIRSMVEQVSRHTETPPEMATVVALGAIATATMRKWDVEIESDFRQPLNVYLCAVMPPGNRKSAVFRRMFEPVHEHERLIRQSADAEFLRTSADAEIWEKQCADLKTRISKAAGDDAVETRRELDHLLSDPPKVLSKPQLVSDDVTPESVCSLLAENHERIGIASAEPEVFDLILGRYSKGPNLGLWLKGHDGDGHTENRRNRPEPIVLNSPLLSLTIMAQPEAIQSAGGHRVMRGRGMLDRFMYAFPPSPVGSRQCVGGKVDPDVQQAYCDRITGLLSIDIPVDQYGNPAPRLLTLSREAHSLWKAEQIRIERRMADSEPLSMIAGWGSKFAAQVARIAANLHLMEHGGRQSVIPAEPMQQAIHIGRFIESHTRAVFQAMGHNPAIVTAQKVARQIVSEGVTEVSRRDVMRIDRTINVTDAQAAIDLMVEHGYLIPLQQEKRRGRPSDRYAVNPAVF
ncbi:MAG: DUF3987 domain-containing protein [Fuerstiella sp.]